MAPGFTLGLLALLVCEYTYRARDRLIFLSDLFERNVLKAGALLFSVSSFTNYFLVETC